MISDWIRGLRDPELLYKKLLLTADDLGDSAKGAYMRFCEKVAAYFKWIWGCFLGALGATAFAIVAWLLLGLFKVEAAVPYQALIILVGMAWAVFLTLVAFLLGPGLGAGEAIAREFPKLEAALSGIKRNTVRWLRVPAWVAFVTLFVAVLMGRFPALHKPESLLSLVAIVAVFGLASFLGVCKVNREWLRRFVLVQLFIAVMLLLIAPQFPHVTAWVRKQTSSITEFFRPHVNPKQLAIDPDAPPPFFDAITSEPLIWYSRRAGGGFVLWDANGFDPDTNEELQPVRTKEKREEILSWLRVEAQRNSKPVKVEAPPTPKRLAIRTADEISFVNQFGSNIVWFFGSPETGFELYDAAGFHRTGNRLQPADSDATRRAIIQWFQQQAQVAKPLLPVAQEPPRAHANSEATTAKGSLLQPVEQDRWPAFSEEGRRVLLERVLRQEAPLESDLFSMTCLSVRESREAQSVIVIAEFLFTAKPSLRNQQKWSKRIVASATISNDAYLGISAQDTVDLIGRGVVDTLAADKVTIGKIKGLLPP